jgi:hypothetical protein
MRSSNQSLLVDLFYYVILKQFLFSFLKISENIDLSNKVCYKCAYELDQCTKFVKKYKDSHKISNSELQALSSSCCLCLEVVNSNRIFDITKDNRAVFSPLQKIRNIFNDDVS